ncbi:patatin-like phospholipase [Halalkalicoccus paucihalophilus]|uniref:Patatin-like phospholipase n=1 Tax=Halalkalicoccus paucihalophilus TaxID=1008153 RepID=A0A151AJF1_9EURY|nr:patatin-like phospholipase family protein [Halalkalicoccus paucihalophilus]KYH27761.1 patatin-like phospholipase [Halalkalicoccus paucihalophilus]
MSTDTDGTTHVAIACQGGGSHTAFTAGVLGRLLREREDRAFEPVAFSGTSGGAVCATAAWYGLLEGGTERAVETLEGVWRDLSARSAVDRMTNEWAVRLAAVAERGWPVPGVSPYDVPFTSAGRDRFLEAIEAHVDFERASDLAADADLDLIVGAADVTEGEFATFRNAGVTAESVLASAAIPTLFEAVEIDDHWYWDGLFSQNPPIREFLEPRELEAKPDEIWIVQINPKRRDDVPESLEEIADRRNELAGNLSLYQEVDFIEQVNDWLDEGALSEEYKPIDVEFIEMGGELSTSSKLDRDPEFIDRLMQRGARRAERFLEERSERRE